jgi:hypothetical protein
VRRILGAFASPRKDGGAGISTPFSVRRGSRGGCLIPEVFFGGASSTVPGRIAIYGFIYEVTTGRLVEVPEATKAGLPV